MNRVSPRIPAMSVRSTIIESMTALLITFACVTAFPASLLLTGCDRVSSPPAGKSCTIKFRMDALGVARDSPVSPMMTGTFNGGEVAIDGTLQRISDEWVVLLDRNGKEVWVPKSVILLIRVY